MTTLLTIANMSLDLLGQRHVQSLGGADKISQLVGTWAYNTYYSALAKYRPTFATKTTTLHWNTSTKGWTLPQDYILVIDVTGIDEYLINNDIVKPIETDTTNNQYSIIEVDYISNDLDLIQGVSPQFEKALAYDVAAQVAFVITKEQKLALALGQGAKTAWSDYSYANNKERRPSRFAKGLTNMSTWTRR